MSSWSGNGGSVVGAAATTFNTSKWTLRKGARLTENTHSGTASTNYDSVVPDNSGTVEIPWDDTNIPDTGSGALAPGAKVTIRFNLGKSGKFHLLTNATIETVEDVDDNAQDIVRTSISFKGGVLTAAV